MMQAARGGRYLVRHLKVRQVSPLLKYAPWNTSLCQDAFVESPSVSAWQPTSSSRQFGAVLGLEHLNSNSQEKVDPFSLVADELQVVANRLRSMVTAEVPVLAMAAEYFFKLGVEGKRFRPMVLLLMSTSLMTSPSHGLQDLIFDDLRLRQQRIAEITEMIHVASLLHDDVLDHADTRRGISSLNHVMGNKLAVLAGDFLLARASVALASLRNTEVVELLSQVLEHLVTGEIMQLSVEDKDMSNMDYYMQKTFYKTASLMANSCKAIAVLAGQPEDVALLAFNYGRHLGLAYQLVDDALDYTGTTKTLGKPALSDLGQGIVTAPVLFALKEFPEMSKLIQRKFKTVTDINQAVEMVKESRGIAQTHALAAEHARKAVDAIANLPPNPSLHVQQCRRALIDIAHQVITRSK
ncbi:solanesyl-diphosphate synthase 1, mitochondrial isoform X2 [Physcomitrium patens]|uniref:Geranyl diphosphate synthase n=1 Tax=Physcomitrium patens TaxID=3218 RepID=A0A2K1K6G9_PHYPA|nr:solanesyl-diphosphate synthase 1, mitochondrial-like isoform X2 [Physcomitrium patens]PNR49370.1 hypothetical protein PHYPA_011266 [Physcomitrium patens]|eukprot:XP_024382601.1 solanesyl-diphosphate synthase 1, mitochondrial-like isoform X2 [Physcomitrella patens]